jgi:hypothetical protein
LVFDIQRPSIRLIDIEYEISNIHIIPRYFEVTTILVLSKRLSLSISVLLFLNFIFLSVSMNLLSTHRCNIYQISPDIITRTIKDLSIISVLSVSLENRGSKKCDP